MWQVLTTPAGWTLIILGCGVGFVFALVVLAISAVSFPLLIDRNVGTKAAVQTSVHAFMANPVTMTIWGLIVAGLLVLGTVPPVRRPRRHHAGARTCDLASVPEGCRALNILLRSQVQGAVGYCCGQQQIPIARTRHKNLTWRLSVRDMRISSMLRHMKKLPPATAPAR